MEQFCLLAIVGVLTVIFISYYSTTRSDKNLDSWIGEYQFTATFPHNSGEMSYVIEYNISIYKEEYKYYAKITDDGWQPEAGTLFCRMWKDIWISYEILKVTEDEFHILFVVESFYHSVYEYVEEYQITINIKTGERIVHAEVSDKQ